MELISNYMRDDAKRHMLNALTQKTFGFDFEGWVTNGYFEGDYIPYSFVKDGEIIANVSANRMQFLQNGVRKNYIQIGTVMTDERFRKQGLAAQLMKHVISEYESACDGIYLFGNLGATGFYEKLGFQTVNEYRYFVKDEYLTGEKAKDSFLPAGEMGPDIRKKYMELVRTGAVQSSFEQINKFGLQMFYTAWFDNVYYAKDIDCFIVLDLDERTALQAVISEERVPLKEVLRRLDLSTLTEEGGAAEQTGSVRLQLGFTPLPEDRELCVSELYDGADDYRLFYRGEELKSIEREQLYFPELSHA